MMKTSFSLFPTQQIHKQLERQVSLLAFLLLCLALSGCNSEPAAPATEEKSPQEILGEQLRSQVDPQRLFQLVETQVNFGPRPSGSEALEKCREWMMEELRSHGWSVAPYSLTAQTSRGEWKFTNIRARYGQEVDWDKPVPTLYGTHYETKLFDEFEFVGANDGGSGTAVLLELARVLGQDPEGRKIAQSLEIVFFDGEEAFEKGVVPPFDGKEREKVKGMLPPPMKRPLAGEGLWGSQDYALRIVEGTFPAPGRVIIWDIVGDPNTPLYIDIQEDKFTGLLNDLNRAASRARGKFMPVNPGSILDDHIPFEEINGDPNPHDPIGLPLFIPAADVIQVNLFNGKIRDSYWHTPNDTLDKVSGEQLAETTKIALQLLLEVD